MDFKLLKLLDRFKRIFEKIGIDYTVMRKILYIKLLMDGRRVPTVFRDRKKNIEDDNKNMFLRSLWIYMLMGLVIIPFVIMKNNYVFQMSLVFGIAMFLIMTSLISDFSTVLLDIRDKNIIGVRPVGHKTLSMVKTLHILYYMISLSAALCGPALVISLFIQGPLFFFMFLFLLVLMDIFCIILTTLVYFLVLRFFDGEKLKDIINYIQIILSIVVMVGYQLIGRMFDVVDINIKFVPHWWQYFIVPIWFSAPFQMLQKSEVNNTLIIFTMLCTLIPIITLIFYIKLIPLFEKNLEKLGNNYSRGKKAGKAKGFFAKLLCRDSMERIFYRFSVDMMKNERSFKLKVYPILGFSLAFPFIMMFQMLRNSNLQEITRGKSYLFIYFCGLILPTLMMMIRYSENYKAAWIYKALPIANTKQIFQGTIKAFVIKIFLPVYFLEAVIFGALYGPRIIPDLIVIFLNMLIFSIISFLCLDKALPFSTNFEAAQQSNTIIVLLLFLIPAAQAGIHYSFTSIHYGIFIYLCIVSIISIILWEVAFNVSKEKLK